MAVTIPEIGKKVSEIVSGWWEPAKGELKDMFEKAVEKGLEKWLGEWHDRMLVPNGLYSAKELGHILRKDPDTINKLASKGQIPFVTIADKQGRTFLGWQIRDWLNELQKQQAAERLEIYKKAEKPQEETA